MNIFVSDVMSNKSTSPPKLFSWLANGNSLLKIGENKVQYIYRKETYLFNDDWGKIWKFVRDITYLPKISKNLCENLIIHKGKATYDLYSEFSLLLINSFPVKGKCTYIGADLHKVFIERIYEIFGIHFIQTVFFYPVTSNNTSLIVVKTKTTIPNNSEITLDLYTDNYYSKLRLYILKCFDKYIMNSFEHTEDYKSCIIHQDFDFVWNFVINFEKMEKLAPMIGTDYESKGPPDKKGSFWKCKRVIEGKEDVNFFIVKDIVNNKRRNWRLCVIEPFGVNTCILNQEINIKVTKLFNGSCHVSFLNIFRQKVNNEYLKLYSKNKAFALSKVKSYLEKIKL